MSKYNKCDIVLFYNIEGSREPIDDRLLMGKIIDEPSPRLGSVRYFYNVQIANIDEQVTKISEGNIYSIDDFRLLIIMYMLNHMNVKITLEDYRKWKGFLAIPTRGGSNKSIKNKRNKKSKRR